MFENIYQPQKLLLSNLFLCLNIDIEDFSAHIYNQILSDINSNIEVIKKYIEGNAEENKSIIPYNIVREIDKKLQKCSSLLEKYNNKENFKLPDYCLLKIYKLLQGLINSIEKNSFRKYSYLPNYKGDMDVIEKYMKCYNGYLELEAEAVSEKNLKEILNPNIVPYNDKKTELVKYILKNVIPKLLLEYESKFFDYVANKEWEKLVFYDLKSLEQVVFYDNCQDIINNLNNYFESINNSNDVNEIGVLLIKTFDNISDLYDCNKLSLTPKKTNLKDSYKEESISNNETCDNYDYDGILSGYILDIIEKLSTIANDFSEEKKLYLVDNIINNNRVDVIKCFKNNNQSNVIVNSNEASIFSAENLDLRNVLIKALLNEPEFLNSYNININNGGNDE